MNLHLDQRFSIEIIDLSSSYLIVYRTTHYGQSLQWGSKTDILKAFKCKLMILLHIAYQKVISKTCMFNSLEGLELTHWHKLI